MTADAPVSGWTDAVIAFLARNTNRGDGAETWDHMYSSAYQMACMALVALGQAEETDRGARRLRAPRLPVPLPRWDDICVAVLFLAQQRSLLHFRLADGSPPPPRTSGFTIVRSGSRPPPPSPNIAAIPGLGPAHATPEALRVLSALGLIAAGRWTTVAECVLWRDAPTVWQMRVTDDPRFAAAVASAITTLPTDRRSEIDRLVTITASDIEESLAQSVALQEQARLKYGPKAQISPPETPEKPGEVWSSCAGITSMTCSNGTGACRKAG